MSNSFFRFKKFTVHHDKCAMKVGTDGVLLGAWARIDGGESVLDVGTGSGLIALMMMQRGAQSVVGIDIEDTAVEQAQINVGQSIWSNSVRIEKADFICFATDEKFDVIVSNPPFYKNALTCPDPLRDRARNADSLPFCQLAKKAAVLLSDGGRLSVIVPAENALDCICEALSEGLRLSRRLDVRGSVRKPANRSLLEFVKNPERIPNESREMSIRDADGSYSADYCQLTADFYLNIEKKH